MKALLLRNAVVLAAIAAVLALIVAAQPAAAHLMPNSVVFLDFATDHVSAELLIPINELEYGSGMKLRSDPAGFAADKPVLARYVLRHVAVRDPDGRAWGVRLTDMTVIDDNYQADLRRIWR